MVQETGELPQHTQRELLVRKDIGNKDLPIWQVMPPDFTSPIFRNITY